MKAKKKATELAKTLIAEEQNNQPLVELLMEMHKWTKQQLQDEFLQKAENAFCSQCKKNPCRNKIEHGSLCFEGEIFLKQILFEL